MRSPPLIPMKPPPKSEGPPSPDKPSPLFLSAEGEPGGAAEARALFLQNVMYHQCLHLSSLVLLIDVKYIPHFSYIVSLVSRPPKEGVALSKNLDSESLSSCSKRIERFSIRYTGICFWQLHAGHDTRHLIKFSFNFMNTVIIEFTILICLDLCRGI